jgi:prolyl-tRNA synthetase
MIPFQNSWGFTTRSIGVMIMIHGDDKGLVMPPKVAPIQIIIVPIPFKETLENDGSSTNLYTKCEEIRQLLIEKKNLRVEVDTRDVYTPGWKYNHWELKGVPLRFEIGPKDLAKNQVRVVRRDNGLKMDIPMNELVIKIPLLLDQIHIEMLEKARQKRNERIKRVTKWEDFVPALQEGCMVLTPFCNEIEWEEIVKTKSRQESLELMGMEEEAENTATSAAAKTLCIPFEFNQGTIDPTLKCVISGKPAKVWILWGRSY